MLKRTPKQKAAYCTRCTLHQTRTHVVIGRGPAPADVLFIGEAPGEVEDALAQAFTGPSGRLLDEMVKDSGGDDMRIRIINTIMCRPPENRDPLPHEILACADNFMCEVKRACAHAVVFIGKIAQRYYKKEFPHAVSIVHPAACLRGGGKANPYYITNINKLKEVFRNVRESKQHESNGMHRMHML